MSVPAGLLRQAEVVLGQDPSLALALLNRALADAPNDATALALRGHCLRLLGDDVAAESDLGAALARDRSAPNALWNLAHLRRDQGRYDAAAATVAIDGAGLASAEEAVQRAGFLREVARSDLALALCDALPAAVGADPAVAYTHAELLLTAGRFDAAQARFRDVLARRPLHPGALLRLAHCRPCPDREAAEFVHLSRLQSTLPESERDAQVAVAFALGKLNDDLGDYRAAAGQFDRGNRIKRRQVGWNRQAARSELQERMRLPGRPCPTRREAPGPGVPVFVVGLPRSGTTLLAARLAERLSAHNRGELNWLSMLAAEWRLHGRTPEAAAALAAVFRQHLIRDDPATTFYIDKNPLNFAELDAMAAFFPDAQVIHCRRDRRDTALSIYQQVFAHPDSGFAYDWDDIAFRMDDAAVALHDWPRALGLPVHAVDYEALVADPVGCIDAWATAAGMALPSVTASGDARPIAAEALRTASVWQSRQPVHQRSVQRWRNYAAYFPALEALDSGLP